MRSAWWDIKESEYLGEYAVRSTLPRAGLCARGGAQLENGGGREAATERLVEQQVEVVALDKDRVVVETAMRLDVAVAGLVGEGLAGLSHPELSVALFTRARDVQTGLPGESE